MSFSQSTAFELSCQFCKEFGDNLFPIEFVRNCDIVNREIDRSNSFIAIPSISPISKGHVLIAPKDHVTSMMQIDDSVVDELVSFVNTIVDSIAVNFKTPIIFEHGVGKGKAGGCGVDHAHLHILPIDEEIVSRLLFIINREFHLVQTSSLQDFIRGGDSIKSYLLFGNSLREMFFSYSDQIPSQYLRRVISKEVGNRFWDWKKLYGWVDFINTFEVLAKP